jgi:hypothetical protein
MILRNLLVKYYYDLDVNQGFININDKINTIFYESESKGRTLKEILYKDLPEKFVKNSVDLFENYEAKQAFDDISIKEILNNFFNLLTIGVIPIKNDSQFIQILNRDLTNYFDLFIQKLINNWLVVIENTFKFTINQYRINKTILEFTKIKTTP